MPSTVRLALLAMLFTAQINGPTPAATPAATRPVDAIDVDGGGVGRALIDWPREQRCEFGVWVVRDQWKQIAQQWSLADRTYARDGDDRVMRGRFDAGGKSVAIEQRTGPAGVRYMLKSPAAIEDLTGLFWFCGLPADAFAGGRIRIADKTIALPLDKPAQSFIDDGAGDRVTVLSRDGTRRVEIRFADGPHYVRVQDARPFGSDLVQLYTAIHEGPLPAGATTTLDVSIAASINPGAARDATVTVDATQPIAPFDGFGGNFVFSIDDPTTDVALKSLRATWARIAIEGREWESGDDEATAIAAADVPGSPLRRRFELARRLNGIVDGRLILTMWYPPERLFAEPTPHRDQAGTIRRDRWPALADGIVAYLARLKETYGVEPKYFSFNESDLGVYLKLDADETRDLTILLGRRFRDAGLRTTILLGDSSDLAKGLSQITRTLGDGEARGFVGALAYHPWAGQNELWPRWATLAEKFNLPLLTTEMGGDADAWRSGTFNTPLATLRLARRYVQQLRDARSRALFEWEWTGDYAMTERAADGTLTLSPRGELLRQLSRHTPTFGKTVAATSDEPAIDAAAVAGADGATAVHLVNNDAERVVRVTGLPAGPFTLRIVDPRAGALEPSRVDPTRGTATIVVPAGAAATLSNVE